MSLTLKQSHAVRQMARLLYGFLPGSGNRAWKGHVSFETVARDVGVVDFWTGGSKESAIATLLEQTLERRPRLFEPLILAIVRQGLTYRGKQKNPVQRQEIETLNGLLLETGFKFPDLWAIDFLNSLSGDATERARQTVQNMQAVDEPRIEAGRRAEALMALRTHFYALASEQDRQAAGFGLEKLLNELFCLFDLDPRPPFRVLGEQIDGSFLLDFETYLVEARWHKHPISEADLLVFRGKIEGKSAFTRGVFIALNGYTREARESIVKGKQPNFFLMDGYDLTTVIEAQADFQELLRFKFRKLAEEGAVFASAKEFLVSPGA